MSNGRGDHAAPGEAKETVVLTLRKRYGRHRPSISNGLQQPRFSSAERTPAQDIPEPGETTSNPWQDSTPGPSRRADDDQRHLSHRLSFDAATGVIMLPDEEQWIEEEESDSDQDYGTPRGQADLITGDDLEQSWLGDPANVTQSPTKRYTTYYHHPERRKRT